MQDLLAKIKEALHDAPPLMTSNEEADYGLYYRLEQPEMIDGALDYRGDLVLSGTTGPDTRRAIVFYVTAYQLLEECVNALSNERKE